jgi:hypothetical protein
MDASRVIAEPVRGAEAGLLGSAGGRFFSRGLAGMPPIRIIAEGSTPRCTA